MTRILRASPQDPTNLGLEEYFELVFGQARQTYATLREKLYRDAHRFCPPCAAVQTDTA